MFCKVSVIRFEGTEGFSVTSGYRTREYRFFLWSFRDFGVQSSKITLFSAVGITQNTEAICSGLQNVRLRRMLLCSSAFPVLG